MNSIIKLLLEHYLASDTFKRALLAVPTAIVAGVAATWVPQYFPGLVKPETITEIFQGILYALGVFVTSPTIKKAFAARGAQGANDELIKLIKIVLNQAGVQPPADQTQPAAPVPASSASSGPGKTAAMVLVLAGLLALGAGLSAANAYDVSIGAPVGSSVWSVGDGGKLQAEGSTVAGLGIVASYGVVDTTEPTATAYKPYLAAIVGGGAELHQQDTYADLFLGIGPIVPGTTVPLTVGPSWRLFSGEPRPAIMVSTSIQFGWSIWRR